MINKNEYVEFTPEGFSKAVESLDFLPHEDAVKIASAFAVIAKQI